jgi:hypothetical protein
VRVAGIVLSVVSGMEMTATADDVLLPAGSVWRYLDNGTDQDSAWVRPDFDDGAWASGPAELGYGDASESRPERTVVGYGPVATNKYITTYFRTAFNVADPARYQSLTVDLLRDDGAVVYLNGRELFRSNMPASAVTFLTRATANVTGAAEATFYPTRLSAINLAAGRNVLAVEVHQANPTSADISFDLRLTGNRPPMTVTLNAPASGAVNTPLSPNLNVTVTHPEGAPMTVTFHARALGPAPGPDFTVVALPDTQYYVASLNNGSPTGFVAQTDWIAANRLTRNIAYVAHLGDLVEHGQNGGSNTEWLHATNAMYRLEDPQTTGLPEGIPYGIAAGNHDQTPAGNPTNSTQFYNQFFGVDHFAGRSYYGGPFGTNNDNHYDLFSAGGLDFIVIYFEYTPNPEPAVLNWANSLLQTHAGRRAIVVSHYLLEAGFNASFGAQGQAIYQALKGNPNLFLMLCGHVPGEGQRQDTFSGRTVYTLLADYQGRTNGGSGFLRLLEFSPSNGVVRVRTYSPSFNTYETDADSEFTLDYDMRGGAPFAVVGTAANVPSGSAVNLAAAGLTEATDYEWFVTVSDGADTVTGPTWRFRTGQNAPPTVSLTVQPVTAQAAFATAGLDLEAAASDPDGLVARVEFYAGFEKLAEVDATPYAANWTNVPAGTYTFTAVAVDNAGARATSAPVTLTVTGSAEPPLPPVAAPSDLTATAASGSAVQLTWADNADNELGFIVERSTNGADFLRLAIVDANVRTFTDTNVEAGATYSYRVCAFTSGALSDYSNVAIARVAPAPLTLRYSVDRAAGRLWLSWPSQAGTVYRVVTKAGVTVPNWTDLSEELTAAGGTTSWSEPLDTTNALKLYRVRVVR